MPTIPDESHLDSGDPDMPEQRRRQELAAFLKSWRAQIPPEEVGLPPRPRRRTPGLRREDVAARASVSTDWYTSLEQARPVRPSRAVIAALAEALRLEQADRSHLFELAGYSAPATSINDPAVDPLLLQQLLASVSAPAYCTDALTNVVAWNGPAEAIFGDYAAWHHAGRNLLRLLFTAPGFAENLSDRAGYAAKVVRTFRERSQAAQATPEAATLVRDLKRDSAEFSNLWNDTSIRRSAIDMLEVDHPAGTLRFTLVVFQDLAHARMRFNAYLPADEHTIATLHGMSTLTTPIPSHASEL